MPKPWHQRQKEQGGKLVLSWFAPRKCWKKYNGGEVKYFQHPDTAEGYEAAVLEYHCLATSAETDPTAWRRIRASHPTFSAMPPLVRSVRHAGRRGGDVCRNRQVGCQCWKRHLAAEEPLPPVLPLPAGWR